MADTAVETVLGIIDASGGTSSAKTLVPALIDLGEIIAGGSGTIADGSVTTAKIADGAITSTKMDEDFLASIYAYSDNADEAVILAADATTAQALWTYGIVAEVAAPDDLDVSEVNLKGLAKPNIRLCWINGTDLELAGVHLDGDMVGQAITMVAVGNTSTISGVLGVDSAWTITANSSGSTIEDGSVTTAKLADDAVTTAKLADGAVTLDKITTATINNLRTIDIHSADVTVQAALTQMGVETNVTPPASMIDPSDMAGEWTDANFHLCWLNASSQLELAPIVVESTAGGGLMAYAIGKDSTASGLMGVDSAWTVTANSSGGGGSANPQYGTCSTDKATAAKVVDCAGFALETGARIVVKFQYPNSAESNAGITLNVNSTGAKEVRFGNETAAKSANPLSWPANALVPFIYDGTYWVVEGVPGSYMSYSSTAAGTADKVMTFRSADSTPANVVVTNGISVTVVFQNGNSNNAPQLGIGGIYKPIWYKGAAVSSTNKLLWDANAILTFVRWGNYWVCTGGTGITAS